MFISTRQFRLLDLKKNEFVKDWQQAERSALFREFRIKKVSLFCSESNPELWKLWIEFLDRSSLKAWRTEHWKTLFLPKVDGLEGDASAQQENWELMAEDGPGKSDYRSTYLDELVGSVYAEESSAQKEIKHECQKAHLPPIHIPAADGRLLEMLLQLHGAKKGLEIGTLGGYSASWLLKGMRAHSKKDHKLWSLELEPSRAELARQNLLNCGFLDSEFEILSGEARQLLVKHSAEWQDLDFVFIDADKSSYPDYLNWSVDHLRLGGMLLIDNSFLWGGMNFFDSKDLPDSLSLEWGCFDTPSRAQFLGMQKTWEIMRDHPKLKSVHISTGEGLGLALKTL